MGFGLLSKMPSFFIFSIFLFLVSKHCHAQNSQQDYLDAHNIARTEVGVGPLTWDDKVAAYAEQYVSTLAASCNLVHSGGPYGENLAFGSGDFMTAIKAVEMWVDEKQYYNHDTNSCDPGKVCMHYTQVVWHNSVRVGCARVQCNNGGYVVSCNYDPPGNFEGQSPYYRDTSISAQGKNTSNSSCSSEFQCGVLGSWSFPFYKSTQQANCGLCKVDCEDFPNPIIELESVKYQALFKSDDFIRLKDPILEKLLKNQSCQSFERNLSRPISPSITYRLGPSLTLFKCNNTQENTHRQVFAPTNYHSYNKCESFTLYYNQSVDYYPGHHIPSSCTFIQLPINTNSNGSGLFDLLTAEVVLGWILSDECYRCYHNGGWCQTDNTTNTFSCMTFGRGNEEPFKKHHWTVRFVIAPVCSCLGFLILFCCIRKKIFWKRHLRFWESRSEDHRNIKAFLMTYGSFAPKKYSYSDIRRITRKFNQKLGQGGYGHVYKGSLDNGSHVAVKVLNGVKGNGEEFINEVACISRTSHVNIVNLVGFCFEGSKRALIYEFMPNGSLEKFIYEGRSNRVRQLGWLVLYKIALGIARGLEYLHRGCNTRILHFDIKPHNILLDDNFVPKISDFGLAKLCMKPESIVSMLGARGTIGYIAPEIVCRNLGGVSHKSDVYSYGMMVLEMVGGRRNVEVEVDRTSEIYFPHWLYQRIELEEELKLMGITNEEEKECARKMVMVSLWCIQTDPSTRPSMTKIVEMLEGNLESLQIPPKPYLFSPSRTELDSTVVELA